MVNDYAKSLGVKNKDFEDQSDFKDDITGLKESHVCYHIGDGLLNNPGYTFNYLAFDVFKGTFMYKYALAVKDLDKTDKRRLKRWDIAKSIIEEMSKDEKYEKPKDDEVVVHLRLGDVLLDDNKGVKNLYFLRNRRQTIKKILSFKMSNVTIVTVSKTSRRSLEDAKISNERSKRELQNFILELEKFNLNVKVKSSGADVDSDFIYKCYAKNLVLTGCSSYGRVAEILNKMIIKK